MPFGKKPDAAGSVVDFDSVYKDLIAAAVAAAGMEPLRADEEMTGGVIHKPMAVLGRDEETALSALGDVPCIGAGEVGAGDYTS